MLAHILNGFQIHKAQPLQRVLRPCFSSQITYLTNLSLLLLYHYLFATCLIIGSGNFQNVYASY